MHALSQLGAEVKLSFDSLQALHALCLTDVALCMPPQDAAKYVRCLAPYLKVAPLTAGPRSADKDRRDAACLLCKLVRPLLCAFCNITVGWKFLEDPMLFLCPAVTKRNCV